MARELQKKPVLRSGSATEGEGKNSAEQPQSSSLVPLYVGAEIARGIQAFRRGEIILYTIRGEPKEVLELMGQLDKQGVDEVIALISHQAQSTEPDSGPQETNAGKEQDAKRSEQ